MLAYIHPTRCLFVLALFTFVSFFCLDVECQNIIPQSRIDLVDVEGSSLSLAKEPLLPEGSDWHSPDVLVLKSEKSSIIVDVITARAIQYLTLQADNNDIYLIEKSLDGQSWDVLWTTPVSRDGQGLRTRSRSLEKPTLVRYLRIRPVTASRNGDVFFSVARFHVFAEKPQVWPPMLDYSIPNSSPAFFPLLDQPTVNLIKWYLTTVILLLLLWCALAKKISETAAAQRTRRITVVTATILCCLVWPNCLNFHHSAMSHMWEFYHYYIGAKYAPELRYTNIYLCTAVADIEDGLIDQVRERNMMNLKTNVIGSSSQAIESPRDCTGSFSPQRWSDFRHDIQWFRINSGTLSRWNASQQDHGFNATPVWMIFGKTLSDIVSVSRVNIALLSFIDHFYLIAAATVIFYFFSFEAACAAICFFCLNPLAPFGYTGAAFLRYDWLFWVIVCVAALKRERHSLAGFALTYATLLRLFPGVVFIGLTLKVIIDLMLHRKSTVLKSYGMFVCGCVFACMTLIPLSIIVAGRNDIWFEFIENTRKHLGTDSTNFMGLPYLVSHYMHGHLQWYAQYGAITAFLILFVFAVAKANRLWVVAILSVGLLPFLTTLSNYYYIIFMLFGLIWPINSCISFSLLVLSWLSQIPFIVDEIEYRQYAAQTVLVLLFVCLITAAFVFSRIRNKEVSSEYLLE